jgi:3-hydroxyisobutyrate dehydrogenase-like beta-hydroxyacid dehydrogenase
MIVANLGAETVAVLGLGEAGALLARDLVRAGAAVRGYDPDLHGDLTEIPIVHTLAEAVTGADVVLSVNWARVALDVAREALPHVRAGAVFADCNTAGPALKAELASIFDAGPAAFVDVAMMAPVPPLGIRVPMFLAGDGAERLASILQRFGTPAEVVGPTAGDAAARKLTRSVFFKGMSAAVWEALEAARAAGVEEWLRSDIARTLADANAGTIDRIIDGTRKHARRRAHEMTDAAALLDQLRVPSTIARAAATSLQRIDAEQRNLV